MELNHQKFKKHFLEYGNYCKRSQWLAYHEGYKFKFGRWLNERINFEHQSDEEILKICRESQEQVYHEDWSKGVNFIVSAKRFHDDFITIGDIEALRKLWALKANISEEDINVKDMSFPKLSIWAGVLIPEYFKILANEKLMGAISYLFDLSDYPQSGFNGFQFANNSLTLLHDAIISEFPQMSDKLIKIALPEADIISKVDRVWLTQDFNLFIINNILHPKKSYFWVNQNRAFTEEEENTIISTSDQSVYHHQSLKEMKEGDLIIHHLNDKIIGYSRVNKEFQIQGSSNPESEENIIVGVNFKNLDNPLSDEAVKDILSINEQFIPKSKSPFDKNLNVAHGYCYPINQNLFNLIVDPDSTNKDFHSPKTTSPTMQKEPLPLNQILYGPPGTGKTYHTVNKALEVIHGSDFCEGKDRSELLKEFNRLKEEGQIGFVTFHQSFSYEDFVEGISPLLLQNEESEQDKDGEVKYELKEGIFKKMCRIASGIPSDKVINNNNHDFDNSRYFKMSIGGKENPHIHDWCIKNGKVALGWGADSNFESVTDHVGNWPEFRDRFKEEFPELAQESRYHIQAMHAFLKMKKGDIVLVSKGNHVIDAVGVIADDEYIYDDQQNFGYYQFRNVHWLASNLNASPELFVSKNISQQTIYEFYDDDIKKEYLKRTFNNKNKSSLPEKYVLIIDEINRGNIAAIFGELITLIEPDKRLGNTEALQTQLPYSKEWFGVPSNLYIIGTMNTADRSVEALDTALRRRFSFEEMLPKPELVSPGYMLARLLWNYGKVDWNDKKYLEAEESLCSLLGTDKEFGKKKYKIWDSMEEEGFQLSHVEQFEKVNSSGINLKEILKAINSRIETLVDRDHTIGHSYFMNVKAESDLRLIFKDKIVPLLQEYFFGDFGKIGLVLGSSFVEKVPEEVQFAQIDGYEETAHLQKERYRLKTIDDSFDIKEALDLLLNKKEPQS